MYVIFEVEIQNGEYRYNSKSMHKVHGNTNLNKALDNHAKTFYGGESYEDNEWHFFNGGEVAVRGYTHTVIPDEEYPIVSKYII